MSEANGTGAARKPSKKIEFASIKAQASETPGRLESAGGPGDRLETRKMEDVVPRPLKFLVKDYIPLGKLILIAGDGGNGKSWLTLDIAARGSVGKPCLGLEYDPPPAFESLMVFCEDDCADTVRPRLVAAGADCSKIHELVTTRTSEDKAVPFSLAHFDLLESWLVGHPDCRWITIDPAGAYIGRTGADDHKDSELRALLSPLAELAARREVTIALVKHFNKAVNARAVNKVTGSTAYINTVRAAYCVAPETSDSDSRRLLLPLKFNLQAKPKPLAYRISTIADDEERDILIAPFRLPEEDHERLKAQLARVVWEGPVDIDTEDALGAAEKRDRDPNKVERCKDWLRCFLKDFAYPSAETEAAAKSAGFTRDNVFRAKSGLKDEGLRNINDGLRGAWWNGFGDPSTWKRRPVRAEGESGDSGVSGDF